MGLWGVGRGEGPNARRRARPGAAGRPTSRALTGKTKKRPHHQNTTNHPQIKDIGSGNFGVAKLMKDKATGEMVAVKFIERGEKVRRRAEKKRGEVGQRGQGKEKKTAGGRGRGDWGGLRASVPPAAPSVRSAQARLWTLTVLPEWAERGGRLAAGAG